MRVPDTIHGGTGLLSSYIPDVDALKKFNPFLDPVVLKGDRLKIKIIKPVIKFKLNGEIIGPFSPGDVEELPEEAGIFLILKGVAQ